MRGQEILPPPPVDRDQELAELHQEMAFLTESIDLDEERARCEGSFIEFFKGAWSEIDPAPLRLNWHHYCIAEHLEAVRAGEIRKLLVNIPPRFGKALDCDTPVLTTWGWKRHGELEPDDFVFGPDGKPKRVLGVTKQSIQETFELEFDDGTKIVASGDHLWEVDRHYAYGGGPPKYGRIRKREIYQTKDLIVTGGSERQRPDYIPLCEPVEFPPRRFLIDPYLLGCWLGDGCTTSAQLYVSDEDLPHFSKLGRVSCTIQPSERNVQKQPLHHLRPEGLEVKLRISGLLGNKHIPQDYLDASIEQRWELLRGLMDTDGCAENSGACTYTTKLPGLAFQVCLLQCSLGLKPTIREKFQIHDGVRHGPYYIVTFVPPSEVTVFNLKRKQDNLKPAISPRSRGRYLQSITPAGSRLVNCILVEGGLYLAGHRLVKTHNTSLITVAYPAWLWIQQEIDFLSGPQASFLCASYGEKPVFRQASAARRLLMGDWFVKRWASRVRIIKDGLDELQNSAGGFRISSSLGGAILGAGANLRILDDPHSTEMAESETERDRTVRLFSEGLTTRRTDPMRSAMIVVMQRLHEGDVSGWILENELADWTHVCLPQRFDPRRFIESFYFSDPRTEDGELLWPELHPKELVDADERTMGPTAFAGQMQQSPTPRGGNIIQRDWWKVWPDDAPEFAEQSSVCECPKCGWIGPVEGSDPIVACHRCYSTAERKVVFPEFSYRILSIDTNYGEKQENAYSAAVVLGVWHAKDDMPRVMLCGGWRGRPPLRTDPAKPRELGLVERFHSMAARHQVDCILIEQRTRGWDLYNELAKQTQEWQYQLQYFNPVGRGDKVARLHACQALFTNDCIWAPNKDWADMVIAEVVSAPRGRFWDLSDCVVQGLLYLRHDMQLLKLPDEHKREQLRERLVEARHNRSNVRELIEG